MAVTATAGQHIGQEEEVADTSLRKGYSIKPRLGVRARQIALLTILVALVVSVTTIINVAHLTGVIVNRTAEEADQVSRQVKYAITQELAHNAAVDNLPPASALARDQSGVRGIMESTIVSSQTIAYLYVSGPDGTIITDQQGKYELAANRFMVGDISSPRPPLSSLAGESAYMQLARIYFGPRIYEVRDLLKDDPSFTGELHIGISSTAVKKELWTPVGTNLAIGLLAVLGAALVAITSANLLLRPLEAISSSIERLEQADGPTAISTVELPHDEVVTGVTARLRQLGQRLAGERSELEIMRGRLRQVISHLEERLLLINREGRVILASPDAEQILGIEQVEMTGLPIDETIGLDHPLVQIVERAFAERRSIARMTIEVPDGDRPRRLLISLQYIEDAGEPVGALVSLRDYESFQKYESQWDLSKKLADLGRITSGIAHEVKNPLNAMVIHLEILRSKMESGTGNPAPQIEILDSEIKRLDRVVQTFLNFTRPVDVNLEPLDINAIVSQVIALAWTEAAGHGVTIHTQLASGQLEIKGDEDLIKQALLNVIINGCQAMPEGGPLKVTTSQGPEGTVHIGITDRGIGITPEGRDRIFNLYYTTKKGGTGIGLAQAFRAIQLHGGTIQFDSQVGVGTTFEITLPALNSGFRPSVSETQQ